VKDGDEVAALRAAIRVADAGQAAARSALAPGRSELELWTETRGAIEGAAGSRVPVLADLVTGPRTAEVGGPPTGRVVGDPDLLLVDLVPRVGAYWADSCATVAVGEPTAAVRQAHERACTALARGVEAIRPGLRCGELDGVCRAGLEYPHHTGHGIGVAFHEAPRVVPGSDVALEPGLVVALEPGVYGDGFGVRVEQVVLVTDDGCEVLSGHDLRL
jgi:Xaa-Pro aminopeptidase